MSKRPSSSTSTPKRKRKKVTAGQSVLDSFFEASPRLDKGKARSQTGNVPDRLAYPPAEQDVSDVDDSLNFELGWEKPKFPLQDVEVIDVDSIISDEEAPLPQPSEVKIEESDGGPDLSRYSRPTEELPPGLKATPSLKSNIVVSKDGPADVPIYESLSVDPPAFPIEKVPWEQGTQAPYSFLAHTLAALSETRSRIAILNILTNTLRTLSRYHPSSLLPALYLLSNCISPPYVVAELGIGALILSKAIQHVSGLTPAALKRLYHVMGDVGDVAFEAKSNVRTLRPHRPLSIKDVYDSLLQITNAKGSGAAKQKQAIVEKNLVAAKGEEIRFLVRTLTMNLRVGAVRTSILTALARAMVLTPPNLPSSLALSDHYASQELISSLKPLSADLKGKNADPRRDELIAKYSRAEALIKKVFVQHPNYDHIVTGLLEGGLGGLDSRVPLTIGIPLHPTLGSPTRSLDEIYERLGDLPFTAEFKYDGQRAQIHGCRLNDGQISVNVFSRHLENMTSKYPDIVSLVNNTFASSVQLQSFIIDSEIVAVDATDGSLKSFQDLSNRARKDVLIQDIKISVSVFAFDLIYLDGEALLQRPFRERRALLRNRFPPVIPDQVTMARLSHVESCESEAGRERIKEFWIQAVNSRCEGLMIKLLDDENVQEDGLLRKEINARKKPLLATYEPDKRTSAWLKLKKDYVSGLGDSLDLVPIGAWHGNGRKAGWWSPVLLAVREPATGGLVAMCKCMSGFSDTFYKEMKQRYQNDSDTCSQQPQWECNTGGFRPDVYFRPEEVWEIRGADVTQSPVSLAALGLVSETRGLSLRFPRFIRVRDDKSVQDASTTDFLAHMWEHQNKAGRQTAVDDGDLVDVDLEEEMELEEEDS